MISNLLQRSKDSSVLVGVKNFVVVMLWVPVIALMWGLGIGAGVGVGYFLYRFGRYGDLDSFSTVASSIDTTGALLIVGGLIAGIAFLYLVLSNVTFGSEPVNETIEQSDEIADNADKLK